MQPFSFLGPEGTGFLATAYEVMRAFFIALDALLVYLFIYSMAKAWKFRPNHGSDEKPKRVTLTLQSAFIREKWNAILRKTKTASPDSLRIAVIEADALVDQVLRAMGLSGAHMADRIAALDPDELRTLPRLWKAHKLRNEIVHEPHIPPSLEDVQRAVDDFEAFLKEVEAI